MLKKLMCLMFLCSLLIPTTVNAADIWTTGEKNVITVVVEGAIVEGDYLKFQGVLREIGPFILMVQLYSPGGDVREAMRIGNLINKLKLPTAAPRWRRKLDSPDLEFEENCRPSNYIISPKNENNCVCASACVFIWLGGIERQENSILEIHRPAFSDQYFSQLQPDEAKVKYDRMLSEVDEYMSNYGFPRDGIDKMRTISSHEIESYMPTKLEGYVPFFDELLSAKCGYISSQERAKYWVYRLKIVDNRATSEERAYYKELSPKIDKIDSCKVTTHRIYTANAFMDHFKLDYSFWKNKRTE